MDPEMRTLYHEAYHQSCSIFIAPKSFCRVSLILGAVVSPAHPRFVRVLPDMLSDRKFGIAQLFAAVETCLSRRIATSSMVQCF